MRQPLTERQEDQKGKVVKKDAGDDGERDSVRPIRPSTGFGKLVEEGETGFEWFTKYGEEVRGDEVEFDRKEGCMPKMWLMLEFGRELEARGVEAELDRGGSRRLTSLTLDTAAEVMFTILIGALREVRT